LGLSDVERLVEVDRIQRLKAAYLRCLDQKDWDEMATLFTEDAVAAYSGGKYRHEGRDAIVAWLREKMPESMLSSHRCSHPEIDLVSDDEATGVWALQDTVVETAFEVLITGAAFYRDRYVKRDGRWLIAETGYKRTFEVMEPLGETRTVTASWWGTDGQSAIDA